MVKTLLFPWSLSEITIVVGVGMEVGPGTDNPRKFESDADCWDCSDTVHGWGCGDTIDCWVRGWHCRSGLIWRWWQRWVHKGLRTRPRTSNDGLGKYVSPDTGRK